jgi:ABC-type sugar transport system substrate-binding protein
VHPFPSAARLRVLALAAITTLALGVAACGDDDEESGGSATAGEAATEQTAELLSDPKLPPAPSNTEGADVAGAQQALLDRFGAAEFTAPGEPFDSSSVPKKVMFIAQAATFPVTPFVNQGFQDAAKAAGVEATICPGDGAPDKNAICLRRAAREGYGAAAIFSVDPKTIAKPLAEAQEAGVKIVSGNNALRLGEPNPENVDAQVSHDYFDAGELGGTYAVATYGADTNAVCLAIPEFVVTGSVCEGFTGKVKELCADCKVQTKEIPVAQLVDQANAQINQALLADKEINFVQGSIDDFCQIVAPTLKRLNKTPEDLTCAGQNGNVPSLKEIRDGGYQRMSAGQHTYWWGWAFFDGTARVQVQDMPEAVVTAPNTLFTREAFTKDTYDGPIDYESTAEIFGVEDSVWQDGFKQNWGVEG